MADSNKIIIDDGIVLPPMYQRVEYLKGDGNAYLSTFPFVMRRTDLKAKLKVGTYGTGRNQRYVLIGSTQNPQSAVFANNNNLTQKTASLKWVISNTIYNLANDYYEEFIVESINNDYYFNSQLIAHNDTDRYDKTMYILGPTPSDGYFYYLQTTDRTTGEKHELIPCYRKEDGVAGVFDVVHEVFYTNAGTGEFIVGADVFAPEPEEPEIPEEPETPTLPKLEFLLGSPSEIRRRMMMSAKTGGGGAGYIQDGLVLCMDASTFNGDTWTDPISGLVMTNNQNNKAVLSEDGGITFAYKWNGGIQMLGDKSLNIPFEIGTIEACFYGGGQIWLNNNGICLRTTGVDSKEPPSIRFLACSWNGNKGNGGVFDFGTNIEVQKGCVSLNKENGYFNGNSVPKSLYNLSAPYGSVADSEGIEHIGTKTPMSGSFSSFVGTIYCIRIYDRHLTEEEVLHNYEIDKERFIM